MEEVDRDGGSRTDDLLRTDRRTDRQRLKGKQDDRQDSRQGQRMIFCEGLCCTDREHGREEWSCPGLYGVSKNMENNNDHGDGVRLRQIRGCLWWRESRDWTFRREP